MKKEEIQVGGRYTAKVNGRVVTVRVDNIGVGRQWHDDKETTTYYVTNLSTNRKTTFRSAAKFRAKVGNDLPLKPMTKDKAATIRSTSIIDKRNVCSKCNTQLTGEYPGAFEPVVCYSCRQKALEPKHVGDYPTMPGDPPEGPPPAADPVDDDAEEDEQCADPTVDVPAVVPTSTNNNATTVVADTPAAGSLAARIAAANKPREVGSLVAGMVPNEEQESILAVAVQQGLKVLVVAAGAGTGKTATLKMLEQTLRGNGQYTAFNTSLVAESKSKFVKASCNTTHSLAFRAVGKKYSHRLGGERMRSHQIAQILGVKPMTVVMKQMGQPLEKGTKEWDDAAVEAGYIDNPPPEDFAPHADKLKVLQADFLAGQVMTAIKWFCQSADREVGPEHLRRISGINSVEKYLDFDGDLHTRESSDNSDRVREYLLPFCRKAWADLSNLNGSLPFSHDVYVKLWQLGEGDDRPVIAADYILLDEGQDTAPVFLDVLRQQGHALLVIVGDDNQQIYEWRGAVNALASFKGAPRRMLSQSYRFGQAVADVANTVLAELEEPTDLVMRGNPAIPSRVAEVERPRCYLYRTNAGAVAQVMAEVAAKQRPHLIGGGDETVKWCQAAMDLQANRGTRHPELCCFDSWSEVVEYSKTDEGADLRLMVKLVEGFGAANIRDALKDMPKEDEADVVVSTAHKSKGREWDTVKLGPDFPTANKMCDADRRLLYVAATRAKVTLDITNCPPFCGGYDRSDGDERWIPGLSVKYTKPMPTQQEQDEWRLAKANEPKKVEVAVAEQPKPVAASTDARVFGWYNFSNKWCLRGPAGANVGERVTAKKKSGQTSEETIASVVKKFGDAWIYGV